MTTQSWLLLAAFLVVLFATVKPLGLYMAKLMPAPRWQPLARLVNGVFRLWDPRGTELASICAGRSLVQCGRCARGYALQRLQLWLPLNPQRMPNVTPDSSFNTAISFVTNTNWQATAARRL